MLAVKGMAYLGTNYANGDPDDEMNTMMIILAPLALPIIIIFAMKILICNMQQYNDRKKDE
jgi:hypothetical protein